MTVRVFVDEASVQLGDFTPRWLYGQLQHHSEAQPGQPVCVRVAIEAGDVQLNLATPGCGRSGGGRPARPREAEVIGEWTSRGLSDAGWKPDSLLDFLAQLRRLL